MELIAIVLEDRAQLNSEEEEMVLKAGIYRIRPAENNENKYDIDLPGFNLFIERWPGHSIYTIPPIMRGKIKR